MAELRFRAWVANHHGPWMAVQGNNPEIDTPAKFLTLYGEHIVMQYTGLRDKNGVDIYEGDIVYGRSTWRGKHMATAVVEYSRAGFYCWGRLLSDWYTHEVIGNIYENPELLKEAA